MNHLQSHQRPDQANSEPTLQQKSEAFELILQMSQVERTLCEFLRSTDSTNAEQKDRDRLLVDQYYQRQFGVLFEERKKLRRDLFELINTSC